MRLADIAHARSGDKGDRADIGLFAKEEAAYDLIEAVITAEAVASYFAPMGIGAVTRYELPNLRAFKFVLEGALGGGAARSLRSDNLGKTLASALLRMEVPL